MGTDGSGAGQGWFSRLKENIGQKSATPAERVVRFGSDADTGGRSGPSVEVELKVQQDQACQILLNAVMWKLEFDLPKIKQSMGVFEAFATDHSGCIKFAQFKDAIAKYMCREEVSGSDAEAQKVEPAQLDARIQKMFETADINDD